MADALAVEPALGDLLDPRDHVGVQDQQDRTVERHDPAMRLPNEREGGWGGSASHAGPVTLAAPDAAPPGPTGL
jgi:hypothetical protein